MNKAFFILLLLSTPAYPTLVHNDTCQFEFRAKQTPPPGLTFNASEATYEIYHKVVNNRSISFPNISREILAKEWGVVGVLITRDNNYGLGLNITGRLKVFLNRTAETEVFWRSFDESNTGWLSSFKDCFFFRKRWFSGYVLKTSDISIGLFFGVHLTNPCDDPKNPCDNETTTCEPSPEGDEGRGGGGGDVDVGYRCPCRPGFYRPSGRNSRVLDDNLGTLRCVRYPTTTAPCEGENGSCYVEADVLLKTIVLIVHLACIFLTLVIGIFVFKRRKTKAISSGMWTILEIILLGACILYSSILTKLLDPSPLQCILEPWARELGFIVCYGAIILKLYRHLIEFRTRKAHRWVVKDTDILKYLLIMTLSVIAYMAAFSAFMFDFFHENFDLLDEQSIVGSHLIHRICRPLTWDFVTEIGETVILIFGIHLSYATRNATTQYHERNFLCAAIIVELIVSMIYYVVRISVLPGLHPDCLLIVCCVRTQLSTTSTVLLVFLPKFWYRQKQVRSLGQEYSCRMDAFKDINAHGPLTGHNSDVEVGEITLADMSPDDIRAELKRLYLQLEIFKSKTICRDNPHISKRRGGRKAGHRRFSLQKKGSKEKNLQRKKSEKMRRDESTTEAEASRTPEESTCSTEGPSTIYHDLITSSVTPSLNCL